jgi:hypothetical protein
VSTEGSNPKEEISEGEGISEGEEISNTASEQGSPTERKHESKQDSGLPPIEHHLSVENARLPLRLDQSPTVGTPSVESPQAENTESSAVSPNAPMEETTEPLGDPSADELTFVEILLSDNKSDSTESFEESEVFSLLSSADSVSASDGEWPMVEESPSDEEPPFVKEVPAKKTKSLMDTIFSIFR